MNAGDQSFRDMIELHQLFAGAKKSLDLGIPLDGQPLERPVREEIRLKLLRVANQTISEDKNLRLAFAFLRCAGYPEPIKARIEKGIRTSSDQLSYDLMKAMCLYGDPQQIATHLPEYIAERGLIDMNDFFEGDLWRLRNAHEHYNLKYGLPNLDLDAEIINAAHEVLSMKYDLVIGILNGGALLPSLLEMLGQNVRYLKWRRHWARPPMLWRVGKEISPIQKANRILVCEDDIATGTTLQKVAPVIRRFHPEQVDVCCYLERNNVAALQEIGFYNNFFRVQDLEKKDFYSHLRQTKNSPYHSDKRS